MSTPSSEHTLDPSFYNPTAEEVAFFKSQTKIDSDEELKQHVFAVQKEAWDVCLKDLLRSLASLNTFWLGGALYVHTVFRILEVCP